MRNRFSLNTSSEKLRRPAAQNARIQPPEFFRQRRTNEAVGRRMDFSSDANANFEGLLEVNREIFMPQMVEKTSPDVPPNCTVVP